MHCPNYPNCQLINTKGFVESETPRERYIREYCSDPGEMWKNCTRFRTHSALDFCPDFVLPDSRLSMDEIMDRFDDEAYTPNDKNP
jgi:hypothetical protein